MQLGIAVITIIFRKLQLQIKWRVAERLWVTGHRSTMQHIRAHINCITLRMNESRKRTSSIEEKYTFCHVLCYFL